MPAPILVHGATGFTGRLVCAALARRGLPFGVCGRDRAKLDALAKAAGAEEVVTVDVASGESLRAAFAGRKMVCACAGPFAKIGEPVLATCARLGVHYVDTTGEQSFVADAVMRYRATAEASGACLVPAMAYEIAPADWAAHLAAEKLGGPPDALDILYATRGGHGDATTRGTKLSALGMVLDPTARQFVGGTLVHEAAAEMVATFPLRGGKKVTGLSFPSPEAVVVPTHTNARSVRTFMAMGSRTARTLHRLRRVVPPVVRAIRPVLERRIAGTPEGPEGAARGAEFQIVAEARREGEVAHVFVTGRDPYGLTAEIQAWAAERAIRSEVSARGVVAPSVGYPPAQAFDAMRAYGLAVDSQ
jgi:short subunit dehydrogenase-like uncharacterized protein